jgi:hypothetical protein
MFDSVKRFSLLCRRLGGIEKKKVLCYRCMNKEIVQGRSNLKPPDTFSGTIEEMIFLQFSKKVKKENVTWQLLIRLFDEIIPNLLPPFDAEIHLRWRSSHASAIKLIHLPVVS